MATKTRTAKEDIDAKGKVEDVRKKVEAYFQATDIHRNDVYEDHEFNLGGEHQWRNDDLRKLRSEKRPVLTFNVVAPIVNFLAGYQLEREQDPRYFPRGPEDEQLGRIATALGKYALDLRGGEGNHAKHTLFRKGIIGGISWLEVGHSYEQTDDLYEGDIQFVVLPENSVYHEVGARRYDRNDASYMGNLLWMTPDECKERWPQHKDAFLHANRDWIAQDSRLTGVPTQFLNELYDPDTGRMRIMRHWYRVPVKVTLLVNNMTGDVQRMPSEQAAEDIIKQVYQQAGAQAASVYQIEQAESQSALINQVTAEVHTFRSPEAAQQQLELVAQQAGMQAASIFNLITRPTTALRVAHLTGWELLDDHPNPKEADWRFPLIPFIAYQDTDDLNHIKGIVRDVKDAQREVNWHHATMLDNLIRGPKSGVWVHKAEHSDLEQLRRDIGRAGFVGEYSGAQPPSNVVPTVVSPDELKMLEFGIEVIMRITGVNAEMLGQTTQKTVSGRAIGARQAGGLVGVGSIFANWQHTQRLIADSLIRCIQKYYSIDKMDSIIGQQQRMQQMMGMTPPAPMVEQGMRQSGAMQPPQQGYGAEQPPQPMQENQGAMPPAPGGMVIPDLMMYAYFAKLKSVDFDVVAGFQEATPTARQAVFTQLMQMQSIGIPVPPQLIVESSDSPYKNEIQQALAMMGQQAPNPDAAKAVSAGQGQGTNGPPEGGMPHGVNSTA